METVLTVSLLVVAFAAIIDIVGSLDVMTRAERAAWAVARANALAPAPAASADALDARIRAILAAEFDGTVDQSDLAITITAYDSPTAAEDNTPSTRPGAHLGGSPNDLVMVRVAYAPQNAGGFPRLLAGSGVRSVAVVRNEAELGG